MNARALAVSMTLGLLLAVVIVGLLVVNRDALNDLRCSTDAGRSNAACVSPAP